MQTRLHSPETTHSSVINEKYHLFPDRVSRLGYIMLTVSLSIYGLKEYSDLGKGKDDLSFFFLHYIIAVAYSISLIVHQSFGIRRSWRKEYLHKTIILLNLFLISAFALNRELPVFENSVPWYCVYILVSSLALLANQYSEKLSRPIQYLQQALLGSALLLYLYMTIYVANFYIIGTVGIILLGIGAHIFVPALLLFAAIRSIILTWDMIKVTWFIGGIVLTCCMVIAFSIEWNARVRNIDRIVNQSVIQADTDLPPWTKVAQTIKNDWITHRILKSEFIYTVSNKHFQGDFFRTPNNWDEKRKHDPLVFIASGNNSSLTIEERKNILKALIDSRHKALERLWTGDNLTTSYIVTDADIYPDLRIAYTEHYLNVRNNILQQNSWSGNSQEAIYTFQLPEGSVVTSLSLWVNGVEEKAILTSKQKATEAYTTIVGREMRDPSVVHWLEGNTVSVRVFPCTPKEERKFKLGITSPLLVKDGKAVYKNVTFRGPNASEATQTSRIRFIGNSKNIDLPREFTQNIKGEYIREGKYDEDLSITMDLEPIKENQFSFDGHTYSIAQANYPFTQIVFSDIYLDINNVWTREEIKSLSSLTDQYKVYAWFQNEFVRLTSENQEEVTSSLHQYNFSLFPFHQIRNPGTSLTITKGKELSPYLTDIKKSAFAEGTSQYFSSGKKLFVFNLEGGVSTYIKSLKELRAFHYTQGNTTALLTLLKNKNFPSTLESSERIVLHESGIVIKKNAQNSQIARNNAPDHLARLFTYNDIMRQVGVNFFNDDFINQKLIDEAAKAYVVSPVSSLIVLETKEDYERFGIRDKNKSLQNASKNASGAVPEPHEWALIILFLLFITYQVFRHPKIKFHFIQK